MRAKPAGIDVVSCADRQQAIQFAAAQVAALFEEVDPGLASAVAACNLSPGVTHL